MNPQLPEEPHEAPVESDVERDLDDLAHALRSPLTALQGGLELLEETERAALSAPGRRSLDVALSAARRLSTLVDDTLDIARARAGQLEIILSVVPARSVVQAGVRRYRQGSGGGTAEAVVDCADVEIVADEERIATVIGRLIEYVAVRAETVQVEVALQGRDVLFTIRATAHGPGEGDRSRGPKTVSRAEELALTMCRSVVELHGGALSVDPAATLGPDNGSDCDPSPGRTVCFTLPTAD